MTKQLPPLMLTYRELEAVLLPLTINYQWGADTIHDLWKMGAPIPNPSTEEVRIVFPGQLMKWLTDVLNRQGQPLEAQPVIYADLKKLSR